MSIRIEAGAIIENRSTNSKYKRLITAWDVKFCFFQQTVFADTKKELEIIDCERGG